LSALTEDVQIRADLLRSLREQINRALEPLLAGIEDVALLDFPNHSNVGDSAIWLGEWAWLRSHGVKVRYACDIRTYSARALRKRLRHPGVVLLSGGGNFGDLWPRHQVLREQVLADLTEYRIVQLPQSIYFDSVTALERASSAFQRHPDVHVLVRDIQSLDIAQKVLDVPTTLCPDMAFALDDPAPRSQPSLDILVLARTDHESAGCDLTPTGPTVEVVDWLLQDAPKQSLTWPATIAQRAHRSLSLRLSRSILLQSRAVRQRAVAGDYGTKAHANVMRGCALLSRGRMVVTDRLHGHILSTLLGIPHVVSDNAYGKVHGFIETWTTGVPGMTLAPSIAAGLRLATELIPEQP
jgi:exopolysaccharide biosynthesis predicted pyruvyltransferase EpsI